MRWNEVSGQIEVTIEKKMRWNEVSGQIEVTIEVTIAK